MHLSHTSLEGRCSKNAWGEQTIPLVLEISRTPASHGFRSLSSQSRIYLTQLK